MTVLANLDGAERAFEIKPADIGLFEEALGSAYAMLRRFTSGIWTARDVANVLSFALHGPPQDLRRAYRMKIDMARAGLGTGGMLPPFHAHPAVKAAVEREGAGRHAETAAEVLTALLFGGAADGNPEANADG